MSKIHVVNEIHKAARKNFLRRHVILKKIDDLWQADLIDLQKYYSFNAGHKYVLIIIDCFSKYIWTVPVKTKAKMEIANAFKKVLKLGRVPVNLQTDMGKEFYNDLFKKVMVTHKINHYSTYSIKKASIVERVIRTIKNKLFKNFNIMGNYKWIGTPLINITNSYNNTVHRITKHKPAEVNFSNEYVVKQNIARNLKQYAKCTAKFSVGDFVRISKYKGNFDKGYTPNWSTEVFQIIKVNDTRPITYYIEDQRHQKILGTFYEKELQKTQYPDIYLIEKVLKRKGDKLFVKWLGLNKAENSWINKNAIV